jgi:tRNA(fMet)-specific endonuclease VapC
MKYLLDTNACVAMLNGSAPGTVGARVNQALTGRDALCIPSVAVHELWYGVAKSERKLRNAAQLVEFLKEPFVVLDLDAKDARIAGEIRGYLALKGTPIGPYDVLIAGQALARGMTLVTANVREFSRVDGLKLEDWTQ